MATKKKAEKPQEVKNGSLKAHYYTRGGAGFTKIKGRRPSVDDLSKRKNVPADAVLDTKYILENGQVFSAKENRVTNEDLSAQKAILDKQK